jgi:hypothetical protein
VHEGDLAKPFFCDEKFYTDSEMNPSLPDLYRPNMTPVGLQGTKTEARARQVRVALLPYNTL